MKIEGEQKALFIVGFGELALQELNRYIGGPRPDWKFISSTPHIATGNGGSYQSAREISLVIIERR